MKRTFGIALVIIIFISIVACSSNENSSTKIQLDITHLETKTQEPPIPNIDVETNSQTNQTNKEQEEKEITMNIKIGEYILTATLEQNSSTEALLEMLSEGNIVINMNDYANMEKVGSFPKSLPRNDEQINTDAGDLILYQGNSFVIYYDTNSWNFTRLGKINNVSKQELREILGNGSVIVELSLPNT